MTKNIKLSIANPCREKWENFTPVEHGGFCTSCQKEVVDFTRMSTPELLDYFGKSKANTTCGRFRSHQLEHTLTPVMPALAPGFKLFRAGFIALILFLLSKPLSVHAAPLKPGTHVIMPLPLAHETFAPSTSAYRVQGVVIAEEDHSPLPGVNVWLQGSTVGTVTDADGKFEFPQHLNEGDVLIFSFIGLQSQVYRIGKQVNDVIEIKMSMEMDIMGQVMVTDVYVDHSSGLKRAWRKIRRIF